MKVGGVLLEVAGLELEGAVDAAPYARVAGRSSIDAKTGTLSPEFQTVSKPAASASRASSGFLVMWRVSADHGTCDSRLSRCLTAMRAGLRATLLRGPLKASVRPEAGAGTPV